MSAARDLTPLPDLPLRAAGENPFLLDSPRPRIPLAAYTSQELRFRVLARTDPEAAERLAELAQAAVAQRWATYEEMAARGPERYPEVATTGRT
jgi:pyruvate-ferredoxin/flavodoxin oxidoreductase